MPCDDPDDREVLVVIGAPHEEGAIERVRRGRDQVDGGEVAGEFSAREEVDRSSGGEYQV
jgi:hypothetical protein